MKRFFKPPDDANSLPTPIKRDYKVDFFKRPNFIFRKYIILVEQETPLKYKDTER